MGLKDIDFKTFLLQKGERVALWTAVAIMAVLIIFGVVVKGLGSGSAADIAGKLNNLRTQGRTALENSKPPDDYGTPPPELSQAVNVTRLDAERFAFPTNPFTALQTEDSRWRKPEVLGCDQFGAALVRAQVPSWYFTNNLKSLVLRVPKEGKPPSLNPAATQLLGQLRRVKGAGNQPAFLQPNRNRPSKPATLGPSAMTNPVTPGTSTTGAAGQSQEVELKTFGVDQVEDVNFPPASIIIPYRMVVVEAAFPYRDQMENIRKALRYPSVSAMLNDRDEDNPDVQKALIEFLSVNVKRRTLDLNGTVIKDWDEDHPPDMTFSKQMDQSYKLMRFQAVATQPEDENLVSYGIITNQVPAKPLVRRLPQLANEETYPKIDLPAIKATLKEQEKLLQDNALQVSPRKSRFDLGYDPDAEEDAAGTGGSTMPGGTRGTGTGRPMGSTVPGMTNPGTTRPTGTGSRPSSNPSMMPRKPRPDSNPVLTGPTGTRPMTGPGSTGNQDTGAEPVLPEHCLVRFLDLDVTPGHIYEYKVQIVMSNPAYDKKELAVSEDITKVPYIEGEFKDVTSSDGKALQVKVPEELFYYAMDDKPLPPNTASAQVQRWLYRIPVNPNDPDSEISLGEWSVLERDLVHRGEMIGSKADVEVPWWDPKIEDFTLIGTARKQRSGQGPATPKVPVDFNTDTIVVDFEGGGGKKAYNVGSKSISDEAPVEMLIFVPDPDGTSGKVVVRKSVVDVEDAKRKERLEKWKKRIEDVRAKMEGGTQPGTKTTTGGGLFGPGK